MSLKDQILSEFDQLWPTVKTELGIDEPYPYRDGIKRFVETVIQKTIEAMILSKQEIEIGETASLFTEKNVKEYGKICALEGYNLAVDELNEKKKEILEH